MKAMGVNARGDGCSSSVGDAGSGTDAEGLPMAGLMLPITGMGEWTPSAIAPNELFLLS